MKKIARRTVILFCVSLILRIKLNTIVPRYEKNILSRKKQTWTGHTHR